MAEPTPPEPPPERAAPSQSGLSPEPLPPGAQRGNGALPPPRAAAIEWLVVASRFAWPGALLAIAVIGIGQLRSQPAPSASEVRVQPSNTVIKALRDIGRLETVQLRVEKVIDVRDHQTQAFGLIESDDAMLFVASGEVIVGVDLMRLRDGDATFDETTKTASLRLPEPEVLAARFDEMHSYVHSRATDLLAKRNEQLEALARKQALAAFEAAGRTAESEVRAKDNAEKLLRAMGLAWGAKSVVITWRPLPSEGRTGPTPERAGDFEP